MAGSWKLELIVWGAGKRVLLVHGSIVAGPPSWSEQRPLGERWRLEVVNRRGYGNSPPPKVRSDFEEDARDIAALLGDGAHLVGHSYGAIVALYAAALRPRAVRSLTVIEPPAWRLAMSNPAVAHMASEEAAFTKTEHDPRGYFLAFLRYVNSGPGEHPPATVPDPLPPGLEQGVRTTMKQREPAEARIPIAALKRTAFPKLIVSGGHHPAHEAVCDRLHQDLKSDRAVIRGAGHLVQKTGAPFNDRLESFLSRVYKRRNSVRIVAWNIRWGGEDRISRILERIGAHNPKYPKNTHLQFNSTLESNHRQNRTFQCVS